VTSTYVNGNSNLAAAGGDTPTAVPTGINQSVHNTGNGNSKKLALSPNVPELIALRYPTGKFVDSHFGDEKQVYFGLVDGRAAYLSLGVAQRIYDLRLGQREQFYICKKASGVGQTSYIDVWLTPEGEKARTQQEMAEETRHPIADRRARASAPAPSPALGTGTAGPALAPPVHSAPAPVLAASPVPAWASHLVVQANALVDAYAACLQHADSQHGNRVKPEDVRSLLQTAYISMTKNGVPYA